MLTRPATALRAATRRNMSSLAAMASVESVSLPLVSEKELSLRWAMASERITTRGDVSRNAPVHSLLAALPRDGVTLSKERAVTVKKSATAGRLFATDALAGATVMDVEEAETRVDSVRTDCLSFAPHLWVEDGALGSSRATELRTRIITDSPVVALAARSLLHRIPLYSAEVFPATLTVYAATLASADIAAGSLPLPGADAKAASAQAPSYTIVDVDAANARATVTAVGAVSLPALRDAMAAAASALMLHGGYRHVQGGRNNPNIAAARADGVLSWYAQDGHWYAPATEAHPDLLPLQASVVSDGKEGGQYTLVLGDASGAATAAAAAKGRLYSAHNAIWHASEGVSAMWAGLAAPSAAYAPLSKALPMGRGALQVDGVHVLPLSTPKAVSAPSSIVVVGDVDAALPAGAGDKWKARVGSTKVTSVPAADLLKALNLA